ncbi:hypothetical protein BDV27DRAFT_95982 [Aspergillus caelatus]|uniref:Uncharacterized protein n=1 Tax=Aspergillus caelatus TaxID=61420 RepID=A0A5N7A8A0_9EURO|nr:uncharacterized protein BDV27DRAFT_95982 [Aspergillus caelatus]KAE8366081.1 hypothetical protein BDV27DRAFT_95982 [Aspergillus caelatus]
MILHYNGGLIYKFCRTSVNQPISKQQLHTLLINPLYTQCQHLIHYPHYPHISSTLGTIPSYPTDRRGSALTGGTSSKYEPRNYPWTVRRGTSSYLGTGNFALLIPSSQRGKRRATHPVLAMTLSIHAHRIRSANKCGLEREKIKLSTGRKT